MRTMTLMLMLTLTFLVKLLDQVEATIVIVVIQDEKQLT